MRFCLQRRRYGWGLIGWVLLCVGVMPAVGGAADDQDAGKATPFGVMAWNIWHGGKEDGEDVGPSRVVDVIRASGVDVVAMQETYGSGERIAEALGFHFLPRGTNVSLLSRYPIEEDISVFEEFKCVGGLVRLPSGKRVAVYSIWLPYGKEIWAEGTRDLSRPAELVEACRVSAEDLSKIRAQIETRLDGEAYRDVPVVIAGDFNSMSHLDYHDVAFDQNGVTIDWETSHALTDHGYRDAYRELHPVIDRQRDRTWTPRFPEQEQDRIDFIYHRGGGLRAVASEVIDTHAEKFPSDHAAVVARFGWERQVASTEAISTRVVSYNIKHGEGMDGRLDLTRAAGVLARLQPDLVGLQEIDDRASRSGNVNQAAELGRRLGMHAAFGPFMNFQGGRYGLAILSRYPFRHVEVLRLPEGNEPRVALLAETILPTGESLWVVNVHFDWVRDDSYRYAQAEQVAQRLRELRDPYVLLGDFNDEPDSRTLALFREIAVEADKPERDRLTFSSRDPRLEIDFLFAAPRERWEARETRVLTEPLTSDHRPVMTEWWLSPRD